MHLCSLLKKKKKLDNLMIAIYKVFTTLNIYQLGLALNVVKFMTSSPRAQVLFDLDWEHSPGAMTLGPIECKECTLSTGLQFIKESI